jgi:hypothetical protein
MHHQPVSTGFAKSRTDDSSRSGLSIERHQQDLQRKNILKRIGPDKGGYWDVIKKK